MPQKLGKIAGQLVREGTLTEDQSKELMALGDKRFSQLNALVSQKVEKGSATAKALTETQTTGHVATRGH